MKISNNWLQDYINTSLNPDKLSEILTAIGLEVGGVEKIESIKGGLKDVVVGHILTCEKHPNADRLSICSVNIGEGEPLQIVCGAPNVATDQKVWIAKVGAELYPIDSEEPFKIGKAKVRGSSSYGMICASDELGLGRDHSGIMVLDADIEVGRLASVHYNVTTDYIFDIDLTPNRSDATSHIGVAEDLAAYLKINGTEPALVTYPSSNVDIPSDKESAIKIEVENYEACPRYAGLVIDNIVIGESPDWLKQKLSAIGVRPINNIVDITNFVLHEMGQPLHAFDADKIKGSRIIVKTLPQGTKFVTLDEVERKLNDTDLMICDGDGNGMCIGGVFGGIGTGVTENTTRIFLESAHFDPEWIRKTSMGHILRTDAARTFEKSTDPNICVTALKRAASLIEELANGKIVSPLTDLYPNPILPCQVKVQWKQINKLIGIDIPKDAVYNIFKALSFDIVSEDDEQVIVAIPTNKADVTREADVIEEILRIYGFDEVALHAKMEVGLAAVSKVTMHQMRSTVSAFLSAQGFNEMQGLSLTDDINIESGAFAIAENERVLIQNTSNVSVNTMRPDLMVSALEAVKYNQNRNQEDLKLFEFGRGFVKTAEGIEETEYLTLTLEGKETPSNWIAQNQVKSDFYTIKKYVDAIADRMGCKKRRVLETEDIRFGYGLCYTAGKNTLVNFGKLSQGIQSAFDLRNEIFFAQFEVSTLYDALLKSNVVSTDISKYPAVKRDLAFVISSDTSYSQLSRVVKNAAGQSMTSLGLFDIYKNDEQLGAGLKSYAIEMLFEDKTRTLTDTDIDTVIGKIVSKVEKELSGKLR